MSRFKVYSPDQAYLLPPSVRDELGEKHLFFFVREVIERLDMSVFEQSYSEEGGELYGPQLMLGVWLYAYALGITSARQVARRLVEVSCVSLSGRRRAGGQLGPERVPPPPQSRAERRLYAGAGVGAVAGHGEARSGGDRFDTHRGQRQPGPCGQRAGAARYACAVALPGARLAKTGRPR